MSNKSESQDLSNPAAMAIPESSAGAPPSSNSPLEDDFQADLHIEWLAKTQAGIIRTVQSASNEAKASGTISETVVWLCEVQDVEDVEHLDP